MTEYYHMVMWRESRNFSRMEIELCGIRLSLPTPLVMRQNVPVYTGLSTAVQRGSLSHHYSRDYHYSKGRGWQARNSETDGCMHFRRRVLAEN